MKTQHLMACIIAILVLSGYLLGQSGWTDDGSVVRLITSTDKVGIGIEEPLKTLHIYNALGFNTQFRIERSGQGYYDVTVSGNRLAFVDDDGSHNVSFGSVGGAFPEIVFNEGQHDLDFRVESDTYTHAFFVQGSDGYVGIGTTSPQSKLAVNGTITAIEVEVTTSGWPDHVFADNYQLMPLDEVETYIKVNRHLPDIPSAAEVSKNGVSLGKIQATLLQKVEELTLYVIDLQKENEALKTRVVSLEQEQ